MRNKAQLSNLKAGIKYKIKTNGDELIAEPDYNVYKEIKIENGSPSLDINPTKSSVSREKTYIYNQLFKNFGSAEAGSLSLAIALDLRSSASPETRGFEYLFEYPAAKNDLFELIPTKQAYKDFKEGIFFGKDGNEIISIEKIYDEPVMVHDLGVKDYHYYFADDVLVHNSETTTQVTVTEKACFLPTTPITLADETKKQIQNIQKGDKVLSYDLKNKKAVVSEVLSVFSHLENNYLIISLNPKDSKGLENSKNFQSNNKIKVTPYHYVYAKRENK